jgi:membrane protein
MGTHIRYYLLGLWRELFNKPIFLWAQAIAFKVLVAMVPVVLLATGITGRILKQDRPFAYVERVIRDLLPSYGGDAVVAFLGTLQNASVRFTVIGAIGIVLTTVTLFTTLRVVLSHIFSEDWHEQRSLCRGYMFDFQMAVQTGVLFVASVGITVFMQTGGDSVLASIGMEGTWLQQLWATLVQGSLIVLPVLISLAMFFQLYWFIPKPRPPKRAAFTGAVTAALMWESGKLGVTEYASRFGFADGWQAALGDTFLLVLLLVVWAYYSGLILNIGALVALLYERRHRRPKSQSGVIVQSPSTEILTDA